VKYKSGAQTFRAVRYEYVNSLNGIRSGHPIPV
jgi:hypothetical protein